jgi:hypothetical protein
LDFVDAPHSRGHEEGRLVARIMNPQLMHLGLLAQPVPRPRDAALRLSWHGGRK